MQTKSTMHPLETQHPKLLKKFDTKKIYLFKILQDSLVSGGLYTEGSEANFSTTLLYDFSQKLLLIYTLSTDQI